jgi:hypothetical protein
VGRRSGGHCRGRHLVFLSQSQSGVGKLVNQRDSAETGS